MNTLKPAATATNTTSQTQKHTPSHEPAAIATNKAITNTNMHAHPHTSRATAANTAIPKTEICTPKPKATATKEMQQQHMCTKLQRGNDKNVLDKQTRHKVR